METLVAVAGGLAGLLVTYVMLFVLDRFVNTPVWARALLTGIGAALAAWFAQGWARNWLWTRRGPTQLAKLLQKHFRVSAIVFRGSSNSRRMRNCPPMCRLPCSVRRSGRSRRIRESISLRKRLRDKPARRWALAGISAAALTAAPFVFAPRAATNALERWAMPWAGIERYTFTTVEALPNDLYVPHGEPFELSVGLRRDAQWKPGHATARISVRKVSRPWFTKEWRNLGFLARRQMAR